MKISSLRALSVVAVGAIVFGASGCGSTKITPGGSHEFAPQTGSIFGRRLPSSSVYATTKTSKVTAKPSRPKSKTAPPKRERAADDYMTRGGFR